jgi:hypothetical protein
MAIAWLHLYWYKLPSDLLALCTIISQVISACSNGIKSSKIITENSFIGD